VADKGHVAISERTDLWRRIGLTQRHDQSPSHVVEAVPEMPPRDRSFGVLEDPDVIAQSDQVLERRIGDPTHSDPARCDPDVLAAHATTEAAGRMSTTRSATAGSETDTTSTDATPPDATLPDTTPPDTTPTVAALADESLRWPGSTRRWARSM
jgi:hypothetical protein